MHMTVVVIILEASAQLVVYVNSYGGIILHQWFAANHKSYVGVFNMSMCPIASCSYFKNTSCVLTVLDMDVATYKFDNILHFGIFTYWLWHASGTRTIGAVVCHARVLRFMIT